MPPGNIAALPSPLPLTPKLHSERNEAKVTRSTPIHLGVQVTAPSDLPLAHPKKQGKRMGSEQRDGRAIDFLPQTSPEARKRFAGIRGRKS